MSDAGGWAALKDPDRDALLLWRVMQRAVARTLYTDDEAARLWWATFGDGERAAWRAAAVAARAAAAADPEAVRGRVNDLAFTTWGAYRRAGDGGDYSGERGRHAWGEFTSATEQGAWESGVVSLALGLAAPAARG